MLELDGIEYQVKTPDENANDLITYVNTYCMQHNIRNSQGEIIQIEENEANPFYMLTYGLSYLTTVLQKLVYSAGCSMSIAESSERQLLNLADIAGVKRNSATKTIIQCTVFANETDAGAVDCEITQELTATITVGSEIIIFKPAYPVTIPINESRQIILVAEQYGSFNISANTITQFDTPVDGFRRMISEASSPGQDQETIASLRTRLQRRTREGSMLDKAADAIQELDGVSLCNIVFNYSPAESMSVGTRNITLPPRQALLFVQGYNDDIANTFYKYLICQTAGSSVTGVIVQNYVSRAGQYIPVYIIPPLMVPIYVRAKFNNTLTTEQIDGLKETISSLSASLTVGKAITEVDVINIIQKNYPELNLQNVDVGINTGSADDPEITWDYIQTPNADELFIFNMDNITLIDNTVVEVSE